MLTTQSRADYPPNPLEKNGYTHQNHAEFEGTTQDAHTRNIANKQQRTTTPQTTPN
jgi:hypothetical protein